MSGRSPYYAAREQRLSECANYWQKRFQGCEFSDFPPSPNGTDMHSCSRKVTAFADFGSTTFDQRTYLTASWAILLGRYSDNRQEVIFGVPLKGRSDGCPEFLPFRIGWTGDLRTYDFLTEVQHNLQTLEDHSGIDLDEIAALSSDAAHACQFNSCVWVRSQSETKDLTMDRLSPVKNRSYSLSLSCLGSEDHIELQAAYSASIGAGRATNILAQTEHVLAQLLSHPDWPLSDVDPCSPTDIAQIYEWNKMPPPVFDDVVHRLFERQCKMRPDAPAVCSWDRDFTYAELDDLSARLAHHLVHCGVKREVVVPTCFEKSAWAVVAMLAIMRAGGACVNLSPSHPMDRKANIIRACSAEVIVTTEKYAAEFTPLCIHVVSLDEAFLASMMHDVTRSLPAVMPTDKAYVLFTSGSTGEPKGIVIEHGSLCTSAEAHGAKWDIGHDTRIFQFASFTFDVSVADIFFSIMRGACVCIPSEDERINDPAGAASRMSTTWANLTPSVAHLMRPDQIPSLRTLVLGGEAPTRANLETWAPSVDLILCTGPAETTIHLMGSDPVFPESEPNNIGRAVGGRVWVVDPENNQRLAPVGCVGEMFIEGRIVSREYLNMPQTNASSYFLEPCWLPPDETRMRPRRLFKSGDLIRQEYDGTYRFVGRKDGQVKIRGQRVELGEIEHQIKRLMPDVERAVPYASKATTLQGRHQLVVFVVLRRGNGMNPGKVREMDQETVNQLKRLKDKLTGALPAYMVPSLYVPVTSIPLTLNGKNDHRKLAGILGRLSTDDIRLLALSGEVNSTTTLTSHHDGPARETTTTEKQTSNPVTEQRSLAGESGNDIAQIMQWNSRTPVSVEDTIHGAFEKQVKLHPTAPAICTSDVSYQITYQELNRFATRLASHLVGRGICRGSIVPLCFDKSPLAVIAMLALFKAGAACSFLSSAYPTSRVAAIFSACKASYAIADSHHCEKLAHAGVEVIAIDWNIIAGMAEAPEVSTPLVAPADLAFVAFTSGSTGTPKGIMLQHRNYVTSASNVAERFGIGTGTRVLQFSAYTFDAALGDITFSLMHGACICTPTEHERLNDLEGVTKRMEANWALIVCSMADTLRPSDFPTLKTLVTGGEPPTKHLIETWSDTVHLHLAFGPSETSIYCMSADAVSKNHEPSNSGTAIGCRLWITEPDDPSILCPIGMPGELLIEGGILAKGYLGNDQLTSAAFISSAPWLPPDTNGHAMLYRTGDMAQYNADGSFNILGRRGHDDQVKLRGQRIELGEIAYHVRRSLSEVEDAIPMVSKSPDGNQELVVFIKYRPGSEAVTQKEDDVLTFTPVGLSDIHALDQALSASMPAFMVPSLFVPLGIIPLTAHMKMDFCRLQTLLDGLSISQKSTMTPSSTNIGSHEVDASAPCPKLTMRLRALWAGVLGLDMSQVHLDSHFLRLGGDSLKAMRLISQASHEGLRLAFADVLRNPTLSAMASHIEKVDATNAVNDVRPYDLLPSISRAGTKQAAAKACGLDPVVVDDIYPCSPLQEGLVMLGAKNPGSYIMRQAFLIPSTVDLERFRQAWNTVWRETAILRTRFVTDEAGRLLQVVVNSPASWSQAADLDAYFSCDKSTSMDLGMSFARLGIVQAMGNTHFVLTLHHALFDGFTMPLIWQRVVQAYRRQEAPDASPYRKFIRYLGGMSKEQSDDYWRTFLSEASKPSWPSISSARFTSKVFELEVELLPNIVSVNTTYTLATRIQAAYAVLLSLYENSEDVVFGLTASGREQDWAQDIAGPTIATVPFRVSVSRDDSLGQLLYRIQADRLDMTNFEHTGLQHIQRINSETADACALRSLLVIQPQEEPETFLELCHIAVTETESLATYPLVVEVRMTEGGAVFSVEYNADVLSISEIETFAQQLQHILTQTVTTSEDTLICNLDVVSPADLRRIGALNNTVPHVVHDCVHTLIQRNSTLRAAHEAICGWDGVLTYEALDDVSARMAAHLRELGVGPEIAVPVYCDKSTWAVVAMYAILRAGGAFVPLDSSVPVERVRDIISQLRAKTIVVSDHLRTAFLENIENAIVPSASARSLPKRPAPSDDETHSPRSLCYIIFTSGSTGRPKGVAIEHTGYLSGALSRSHLIERTKDSRVLQFNSYSFDACIEDIFTTLIVGGTVCIRPKEEMQSNLSGAIQMAKANVIDCTPSVATLITPADVPALQTMIMGGEALTTTVVSRWSSAVHLINTYGPTECAIVSSTTPRLNPGSDPANIGRTSCGNSWIADPHDHHRLVPYGCVGELLIDGPTLAREYLHDPEKTKAAFVEDMPWHEPLARLYKTGDLVRYMENGDIQFVGRKDTQIKIRGQRVELTEIERHLRLNCTATDVAVEFVKLAGGRQLIAAFVCHQDSAGLSIITHGLSESGRRTYLGVQARLAQSLPQYMLPAIYVVIDRLPVTVSGKVDRKRLRTMITSMSSLELDAHRLAESGRAGKPTSRKQRLLQKLWSHALKIPSADIESRSNFFAMGGDSIDAMRLASIANKQGFALGISDIFRNPVLADMAQLVGKNHDHGNVRPTHHEFDEFELLPQSLSLASILADAAIGLTIDDVEDAHPTTPLQEGLLTASTRQTGAYTAQFVYKFQPGVDVARFRDSWMKINATHAILRTRIIYVEGYGSLQLVARHCTALEESDSLAKYLETSKRYEMGYGTALLRHCIIKGSEDEQPCFAITAHHAIFDGYTFAQLSKQAMALYKSRNEPPPRPPPYARFIDYLRRMDPQRCEQFWDEQLAGSPTYHVLAYQVDAHVRSESVRRLSLDLDVQQRSQGVLAAATTATLIRAAWAITLARYADSRDVLFGCTLSGRSAPVDELSNICGPTIATVPVRISLEEDMPLKEWVAKITEQATSMIPYEQYGLANMRKINSSATAFESLLVVQPSDDGTFCSDIMEPVALDTIGDTGYHTQTLVLVCTIERNAMTLKAVHNANIIPPGTMDGILESLAHVIRQLSTFDDPKMTLKQVNAWPATHPPTLATKPSRHLAEVLSDNALAYAGRDAVQTPDRHLSFAYLHSMSSRLAAHVVQVMPRTTGAETPLVPVMFTNFAHMAIAIHALMKAGVCFTVLDAAAGTLELRRQLHMIDSALLLTDHHDPQRFLPEVHRVLKIDHELLTTLPICEWSGVRPAFESPAMAVVHPTDLSRHRIKYYSRRALATLVASLGAAAGFTAETRILYHSSGSSAIATITALSAVSHGGCVIVDDNEQFSRQVIKRRAGLHINTLCVRTSRLDSLPLHEYRDLRTVLLYGERVPQATIANWSNKVSLRFLSGQCPTSDIQWLSVATLHSVEDAFVLGKGAGCDHIILDSASMTTRTPPGAVGEIAVAGEAVATLATHQELRQNDRLTLHRTGLNGYSDDKGVVTITGWTSNMARVRGRNISLPHVLYYLQPYFVDFKVVPDLSHEGSDALSVKVFLGSRQDADDVSPPEVLNPSGQLQDLIKRATDGLPYCVPKQSQPSVYVCLSHIPKNEVGQPDRASLRMLADSHTSSGDHLALHPLGNGSPAKSDQIEVLLQTLWAQVLGIDRHTIRREDSFFALGGDSIAAMRLAMALAKHSADTALTVADIFRSHVLMDMATRVRPATLTVKRTVAPLSLLPRPGVEPAAVKRFRALAPNRSLRIEDVYPCTPHQEALMTLSVQSPAAYKAYFPYSLPPDIDIARFQASWQATVDVFDNLRTRIIENGENGLLQVLIKSARIEWIISQSLEEVYSRKEPLPSGFGQELVRFHLVLPEDEQGIRCFVMHINHAIYDAWTTSAAINYAEGVYHSHAPSAPARYNTFMDRLSQIPARARDHFWMSELDGLHAKIFPPPSPQAAPRIGARSELHFEIPQRSSEFTVSILLQASWALTLAANTNANDVLFGLTLSGRDVAVDGIESVAGPTTMLVPCRVQILQQETCRELLNRMQKLTAGMMEFGHLGIQGLKALAGMQHLKVNNIFDVNIATESPLRRLHGDAPIQDQSANFHVSPLMVGVLVRSTTETKRLVLDFHTDYDSTVISEAHASRLLNQLCGVFQQLDDPDRRVRDVEVCTQAERDVLLQWSTKSFSANVEDAKLLPDFPPSMFTSDEARWAPVWIVRPDNPSRLTPIGAPGELCFEADAHASAGSVNSRRSIILNPPWAPQNRPTAYKRTGRIAKYTDDGTMTLVSHISRRNLVHGQLVEVEDVESVIREHVDLRLDISMAAEYVRLSGVRSAGLIVFISTQRQHKCNMGLQCAGMPLVDKIAQQAPAVKAALLQRLPSFMLPQGFLVLNAIPTTASGETDRERLARFASHIQSAHLQTFTVPKDMAEPGPTADTEALMKQCWSTVLRLGASQIQRSDHFVALGGDSVSAMRLVAHARSVGIRISVVDVLTSSNLAELASRASTTNEPAGEKEKSNDEASIEERALRVRNTLMEERDLRDRVRRHISPNLSAIEDVAEAHDYQAEAVLSGLTTRRGWSNYVVLDSPHFTGASQLEAASRALTERHSILRTVFFAAKQRLIQIIYRQIEVQFQHFTDVDDLAQACKAWTEQDKRLASTLLVPNLRAATFTTKCGMIRFAIGLSHALWDGISLRYFCQDFLDACAGRALPRRPAFAEYAHFVTNGDNEAGRTYWRSLLHGSEMTKVLQLRGPTFNNPQNTTLERRIGCASTAEIQPFTFATVLKAAWASILAQWSKTRDVTFGHLVSGRAVDFPAVDQVMGPCLGLIPVRIRLDDAAVNPLALLKQVHEQHLRSTPFEHMGFQRIVRECTEWPRWTRCSSLVLHQNSTSGSQIDASEPAVNATTTRSQRYSMSLICPEHDSVDLLVISIPDTDRTSKITLSFSRELFEVRGMQIVLDALCQQVTNLMDALVNPSSTGLEPLCSDGSIQALPRIPLTGEIEPRSEEIAASDPGGEAMAIVTELWDRLGLAQDNSSDLPFWDISGDITPAVQMVEMLHDEQAICVSLEEILKTPTIRGVASLVKQKTCS